MKRTTVAMMKYVGNFAENKDRAKEIRIETIMPALSRGEEVELDFSGISGTTQSFIHALISDPIREFGDLAYENIVYSHANTNIRKVISIVYRYMQESLDNMGHVKDMD